MSWQSPFQTDCNGQITRYVIQYARVGSDDDMIVNVSDVTTLTISGLFACVIYAVRVAAVNANGTGPFSKSVVATSGEDSELNLIHKYVHSCSHLFYKCTLLLVCKVLLYYNVLFYDD